VDVAGGVVQLPAPPVQITDNLNTLAEPAVPALGGNVICRTTLAPGATAPNTSGNGAPVALFRTPVDTCTAFAVALPVSRIVMLATY
jgi:hypothetical protein